MIRYVGSVSRVARTVLVAALIAGCSSDPTDGPGYEPTPASSAIWNVLRPDGTVAFSRRLVLEDMHVGEPTELPLRATDTAFVTFARQLRVERTGDTSRVFHSGQLVTMIITTRGHVRVFGFVSGRPSVVLELEIPLGSIQPFAEEEQEPSYYDGTNCLEYIARLAWYTVRSAITCAWGGPYNPVCDYYALQMAYYGAKVVLYC
jgi:hypothetical protein